MNQNAEAQKLIELSNQPLKDENIESALGFNTKG